MCRQYRVKQDDVEISNAFTELAELAEYKQSIMKKYSTPIYPRKDSYPLECPTAKYDASYQFHIYGGPKGLINPDNFKDNDWVELEKIQERTRQIADAVAKKHVIY